MSGVIGVIAQATSQITQVVANAADKSADRKQERLQLQYAATQDKQRLTIAQNYTNYLFWGFAIIGGIVLLAIIFKKPRN